MLHLRLFPADVVRRCPLLYACYFSFQLLIPKSTAKNATSVDAIPAYIQYCSCSFISSNIAPPSNIKHSIVKTNAITKFFFIKKSPFKLISTIIYLIPENFNTYFSSLLSSFAIAAKSSSLSCSALAFCEIFALPTLVYQLMLVLYFP